MLRAGAAASLLIWLVAFGFCSAECLLGDFDSEHTEQQTAGATHDTDKHNNHDDPLCVSLHSLALTSANCLFSNAEFSLVFALDFISTARLVTVAEPKMPILRQPPDRGLVFTPEVYLGPAFRSHAPPSFA